MKRMLDSCTLSSPLPPMIYETRIPFELFINLKQKILESLFDMLEICLGDIAGHIDIHIFRQKYIWVKDEYVCLTKIHAKNSNSNLRSFKNQIRNYYYLKLLIYHPSTSELSQKLKRFIFPIAKIIKKRMIKISNTTSWQAASGLMKDKNG